MSDVLQVVRDVGLVVPDIVTVIVILYEMIKLASNRKVPIRSLFHKAKLTFCLVISTLLVAVGKNL